MTTQKHTPGKWTAFGIDVRSSPVVLEGKLIAETRDYPMGSKELEESYANARLIAAAPELLEALKELNGELDRFWNGDHSELRIKLISASQRKCADAIAKAEGKQ